MVICDEGDRSAELERSRMSEAPFHVEQEAENIEFSTGYKVLPTVSEPSTLPDMAENFSEIKGP